jgi:hypothetical protein
MKRKYSLAIFLVAALCIPDPAFPWGTRAHAVIDRTAVDTLPDDGPVFLKKYADYIAGSARFRTPGVRRRSLSLRSKKTPTTAGSASSSPS